MDNRISWDTIAEKAEKTLKDIPRGKRGPAGRILYDSRSRTGPSTATSSASGKREHQADEQLSFPEND